RRARPARGSSRLGARAGVHRQERGDLAVEVQEVGAEQALHRGEVAPPQRRHPQLRVLAQRWSIVYQRARRPVKQASRGGSCRVAWDPAQYLKFADHRLRPAIDLLNRIDLEHPADVYDLGAGAGNVTRLIKERWPDARVTGVDDSESMLAKAAATAPSITW